MTDKVQKIREEVVRMHSLLPVMDGDNISVNYADRICTTLEMYIDFLQEEPKAKFKVGDSVLYLNEEYVIIDNKKHYTLRSTKERTSVPVVHIDFGNEDYELCLVEKSKKCMYSKDNYTDEDRKVLCDGCEEECEFNKKEDSVSEIDFEQELYKYFGQVKDFTLGMRIAKRFYGIGRNYQEPVSEEQVKESAKTQHVNKTCKENGDSLTQESVSEGLEEAANNAVIALAPSFGQKYSDGSYVSSCRDCFKREELLELFKAGANWQKQQMERYRIKHCKSLTNEQAELEENFVSSHVEKNNRIPTFIDAIEYGMEYCKQQMMKDAIDTIVKVDAGGYPYIPQIELYDYYKDISLAREGDKYKVILIKEG